MAGHSSCSGPERLCSGTRSTGFLFIQAPGRLHLPLDSVERPARRRDELLVRGRRTRGARQGAERLHLAPGNRLGTDAAASLSAPVAVARRSLHAPLPADRVHPLDGAQHRGGAVACFSRSVSAPQARSVLLGGATVACATFAWRGRWEPRDPSFPARMTLLLLATLLANYHSHGYGAAILAVPLASLVATRPLDRATRLAIAAGLVLPDLALTLQIMTSRKGSSWPRSSWRSPSWPASSASCASCGRNGGRRRHSYVWAAAFVRSRSLRPSDRAAPQRGRRRPSLDRDPLAVTESRRDANQVMGRGRGLSGDRARGFCAF